MSKNDRKALGKGLHALLPRRDVPAPAVAVTPEVKGDGTMRVRIEQVSPNPNQPRREFDQNALLELAQSIEREGIIQPILVRRIGPEQYQIIAGERRWRAAGLASVKEVPVVVRDANDEQVLELAIVENIQREDLNPIELAEAFHRMTSELGLSHDQIGERTGKDRATITNCIRLLQLPGEVRDLVANRKISSGHARALLKISGEIAQRQAAETCIREGWSVRQIEEFTKPVKAPVPAKAPEVKAVDPNVKAAISELERALGTRVRISDKANGKGTIEIDYYSTDDLDRIYSMIVTEDHRDISLL